MTQVDIYRVKNSCMYIVALSTKNRLSHHWKFDEPFGAWSHFENFWREPVSISVKVVFLVDEQHNG
jgi:hypothetical protein